MKAYTDLEQSRKLFELLGYKGADMYYYTVNGDLYKTPNVIETNDDLYVDENSVPCWSLAVLLEQMNRNCYRVSCHNEFDLTWTVEFNDGETKRYVYNDNPIDACYEMILKLHEQNLL